MARIAVLDGHPDPDPARFVHALADAYARGAEAAGHEVLRIALASLDFPLLRSRAEWIDASPLPVIAEAQETLRWASHWAIFHPLWLGEMPALLKGFFEQIGRPGFALDESGQWPRPLLTGRSARVVITMGMPALAYRLWFGAPSYRALKRHILEFSGVRPVRASIIGMVEASPAARSHWLAKIERLGAAAR